MQCHQINALLCLLVWMAGWLSCLKCGDRTRVKASLSIMLAGQPGSLGKAGSHNSSLLPTSTNQLLQTQLPTTYLLRKEGLRNYYGRSLSPAYNSKISKCNCNFPFNWNVPILVVNDYWTCQEAVYTSKPHLLPSYPPFLRLMARGSHYEVIIGN